LTGATQAYVFTFSNPRSATLFEQAVVSATGFLVLLFFARHLPTLHWAALSFAFGLLLVTQGMQLSIVILPMISFSQGQPLGAAAQSHWAWLSRAVLAAMLVAALLTAALVHAATGSWMADSFFYAALLMPPAFAYEHLRRRLILARRFKILASCGLAWACGAALSVLFHWRFGGPTWLAALSFWPGMVLAWWVSGQRERLRWSAPPAQWLAPLRNFAPPAVGSSLAMAGYSVAIQALLGGVAGAPAVAAFNATRMLIQPVNTLIGAFNNLDMPRSASAYALGGRNLMRFQARSMLRLLLCGGTYLLLLALFTAPVLQGLFGGRYSEEDLAWAWLLVGLLMLVATPTENAFYVTRDTRRLLLSRLAAAAVGCTVAWFGIAHWGAVGAVLGIAAGWSVALIGGVAALWAVRRHGPAAGVA
jgi:O-antigen/teichoic acid export membrane protein